MDVSWGGFIFIWAYFFWPLIVSLMFLIFQKGREIEFLIVSLILGAAVFYIPNILNWLGILKFNNSLFANIFFYSVVSLPVCTSSLLTIKYRKQP